MRHITVRAFGEPPCHGEIVTEHVAPEAPREPRLRSLPILGQGPGGGPPAGPATVWRCTRCEQKWEKEPLPDEAL
jgi:hypothetical protein